SSKRRRRARSSTGSVSLDGNAALEQAMRSPDIARLIYAHDVMGLVGSSGDHQRRFRKISENWHWFLGFGITAVKK
ncbi:hypothetical protein LTR22_027660, partial [Elasticomyces elasticus]